MLHILHSLEKKISCSSQRMNKKEVSIKLRKKKLKKKMRMHNINSFRILKLKSEGSKVSKKAKEQ